jgi:hypothetical protein
MEVSQSFSAINRYHQADVLGGAREIEANCVVEIASPAKVIATSLPHLLKHDYCVF